MKVAFRAVAVSVMLALAWAGPLAPLSAAQQQPAAPPTDSPSAQPQMDPMKPEPHPRGIDVWDVGAVGMTAFGFPLKVVICGLGGSVSLVTFIISWAARPDASAGILDEACGTGARWIVRGDDIRPRPSNTKAFEWEAHRFQWQR